MNIYYLDRINSYPLYDEPFAYVIAAENLDAARRIAETDNSCNGIWLDVKTSECNHIGVAVAGIPEGIILIDTNLA